MYKIKTISNNDCDKMDKEINKVIAQEATSGYFLIESNLTVTCQPMFGPLYVTQLVFQR